jgi:hypothetical protein
MNTEVPYAYPVEPPRAWQNFARDLRTVTPMICRVAWGGCMGWTALICLGLLTGEPPLMGGVLIVAGYVACRALEGAINWRD